MVANLSDEGDVELLRAKSAEVTLRILLENASEDPASSSLSFVEFLEHLNIALVAVSRWRFELEQAAVKRAPKAN